MSILMIVRCMAVHAVICGGVHVHADEGAELTAQLKSIDQRAAAIDDLTATFNQRKHTVLLREPIVSSGIVRVRGQQMRWDTREPRPSSMFMDDSVLQIHYPDHNTLEVYELDDRLAQLAASPLPRFQTLREHFEIASGVPCEDTKRPHVALRLTPRGGQLAQHVRDVRVVIDLEHAYILRMELTDIDEERTVIVLSDHRINTGIAADALQLTVPPGTRQVRPLEDLRGGNTSPTSSDTSGTGRGPGSAGEGT